MKKFSEYIKNKNVNEIIGQTLAKGGSVTAPLTRGYYGVRSKMTMAPTKGFERHISELSTQADKLASGMDNFIKTWKDQNPDAVGMMQKLESEMITIRDHLNRWGDYTHDYEGR